MESIESFCNALARFKVLDVETIRALRTRWRELAGERAEQVAEFQKWLVLNGSLTNFQVETLRKEHGDQLILDDYKVIERIGRGRMAGVYKAVHRSGQAVALKVLPPSRVKHAMVLGRFLREARLAALLSHDNVVRTFHSGKTGDGMHYIAMELLDGETLQEVLQRRKRLPVDEALHLLKQVLAGLDHLDEKGLVHRDIKPANIMLVPAPAAGEPDTTFLATPKILDIGLSRALFDESGPESAELTRQGVVLGTMTYMAPEQALDPRRVDIRADIYSLGCVFYEMLAGQPPFVDTQVSRQKRRHAEEEPRPVAELSPEVPEPVAAIVHKMLEKDPILRYQTPRQLLKDLHELKTEPHPETHPAPPLASFLTWVETRRAEDAEPISSPTPPPPTVSEPVKKPVVRTLRPKVSTPEIAPLATPVSEKRVETPRRLPTLLTRREWLCIGWARRSRSWCRHCGSWCRMRGAKRKR